VFCAFCFGRFRTIANDSSHHSVQSKFKTTENTKKNNKLHDRLDERNDLRITSHLAGGETECRQREENSEQKRESVSSYLLLAPGF
jgi:hypothetical protein